MSSPSMDFSVIICTYNRADSLRETLASVVEQNDVEGINYEILVIDNNSSDHTKDVTVDFIMRHGDRVKYFFEEKQGVAYARNRGIKESTGPIIAFIDDDVLVSKTWMRGLKNCFDETAADAVGGRISRKWNCDKPKWYTEELGGCLISQEWGDKRKKWDSLDKHMVTANIAFHRSIFKKYGLFREDLGRRGDDLVGGEDRDLYYRLLANHGVVIYEPEALAYHKVETERLTKEYFEKWFFDVGRTLGHTMRWKWTHLFTVAPLWVWKKYILAAVKRYNLGLKLGVDEATQFSSQAWKKHYGGMLAERFALWLPFKMGRRWSAFSKHKI